MRIVIIGAGLAGSVAAGAFSVHNPVVYESKLKGVGSEHKAVMRLRDPTVANYLGVSLQKIVVRKAVYWEGDLHESADVRMNNLYSLKTYGELGVRSLNDMGEVKRYLLLDKPVPNNVFCGFRLERLGGMSQRQELVFRIIDDKAITRHPNVTNPKHDHLAVEYDICISTIPMPFMLQICGMPCDKEMFKRRPIHVTTAQLSIKSSVHQTIYFPSTIVNAYRATLQGNKLIIESTEEDINLVKVLDAFGLSTDYVDFNSVQQHTQSMGKMMSIPEDQRRKFIYELTDKYGIYSLGRFAVWKPIRADHLVGDVEKIKRMVKLTHTELNYERRLNS